jgi:GntR family transcriptional regulator/MocR family aminotransferase
MVRYASSIPPGLVSGLRASEGPAYQQIYEAIRQAILSRQIEPDSLLPSSTSLATDLGVSRTTTFRAYDMLLNEGYVYGIKGSGTYVAQILPDESTQAQPVPESGNIPEAAASLSQRGEILRAVKVRMYDDANLANRRPFSLLEASTNSMFPVELWAKLVARRYRRSNRNWLDYGDMAGYWPLREAIADYLRASRAVNATAEQVVVFAGLPIAVTFIAQVLTDPGDAVWVEEPGWGSDITSFDAAGGRIVPIPVDEEGFDVQAGMRICPEARLVVVSPSCQQPLGMTMSMSRRLALLQWAKDTRGWIVENDQNGEFRYRGRPLPSLQGLDQHGRTIYLGTFSKTLFPSIRLAYAVVPAALVNAFVQARTAFDLRSPVFEQTVVTDFMREGHFGRHIRRLRREQGERQAALLTAAGEELVGLLDIVPREAGMELTGWLPEGVDEQAAVAAAHTYGITVTPLGDFYYDQSAKRRPGLVLGYVDFEPEEIQAGVGRLAEALRSVMS